MTWVSYCLSVDHWSIKDRLTINQLSNIFRSCIDHSYIARLLLIDDIDGGDNEQDTISMI